MEKATRKWRNAMLTVVWSLNKAFKQRAQQGWKRVQKSRDWHVGRCSMVGTSELSIPVQAHKSLRERRKSMCAADIYSNAVNAK
eukprot:1160514-Pelagomonas_calceolata.AAC.10